MSRVKNKRSQNRAGRPDSKSSPPKFVSAAEITIESAGELEVLIEARRRHERIQLNGLLERVHDPADLLRRVRALLATGGEITATVANAQHYRILRGLFHGAWLGAADPVLPAERLRFFTRRELEKLFYRAGYAVRQIEPLRMPVDVTGPSDSSSMTVRLGELEFDLAKTANAQDILPEAFRVTGIYEEPVEFGLTSIVILTHNQWEYTRRCLESIRYRTDEPYELIVVDNGSSDGTPQRLSAMEDVRLIANAKNRGFPAGVNQGIQAAEGRQVLLLNNDVVVTTGWLRRQLAALYKEPAIGLVGPCSNEVSGPQQIAAEYDDLSALDGFAWEWGKRHAGKVEGTDRLVGFCLLIRRELIDKIGLFDERFGIGNFEDDDYCRRALSAGYQSVIARDAFVHHFGHRTFSGAGIDLKALLNVNARLFEQKWSRSNLHAAAELQQCDSAGAVRPTAGEASGSGSTAILASRQSATAVASRESLALSLCMIVRDNEQTIRSCLESIKPWVDEMIVVDTGSRDATPEIAASLGARVFHFPWCDSFSAARNESLRHARGRWIFWMDSDDVIDEACGRELQQLALQESPPSTLAYVMQVHCPKGGPDGDYDVTVVDHVKLIRNLPELRFEGRIHEQLLGSIRRLGGEVTFTSVYVVHAGADRTAEGRLRKLKRDFKLLKLELAERPAHPFTLFNLGMTYADAGKHRRAVTMLRESIAHSQPGDSQVRKAYALLISSLSLLNRHDEAGQVCQEALRLYPHDPELRFREALLEHRAGRLKSAERAYLQALANREERHFSSIDRGIVGFKARQNLAAVYTDMDALPRAEEQWRQVVEEAPAYRDGWLGLVDNLIEQRRLPAARDALARLAEECTRSGRRSLDAARLVAEARLAEAEGDGQAALSTARFAVRQYPDDRVLRDLFCRLLFYYGDHAETEENLARLVELEPTNGAAQHNLGLARLRRSDFEGAVRAFEASLRARPDSTATQQALAGAKHPLYAAH